MSVMWKVKDFLYAHRAALVPILLVAVCAWYMSRQHRQLADAERRAEAANLALKGQIVENEASRRALQSDVQVVRKENPDLAAVLDTAQSAAPGAKPASVSRFDTGPLKIVTGGSRMYLCAPPTAEVPAPVDTTPPVACAVRDDQHLSVEVDQVELTTDGGNTIAVGAAKVYVLDPEKALLVHGPFRAPLSTSAQLERPSAPRWGVEVTYRCAAGGCGPGGGVLFPPFTLPLVGWRAEGRLGATLGAASGVEAGLGVRF